MAAAEAAVFVDALNERLAAAGARGQHMSLVLVHVPPALRPAVYRIAGRILPRLFLSTRSRVLFQTVSPETPAESVCSAPLTSLFDVVSRAGVSNGVEDCVVVATARVLAEPDVGVVVALLPAGTPRPAWLIHPAVLTVWLRTEATAGAFADALGARPARPACRWAMAQTNDMVTLECIFPVFPAARVRAFCLKTPAWRTGRHYATAGDDDAQADCAAARVVMPVLAPGTVLTVKAVFDDGQHSAPYLVYMD